MARSLIIPGVVRVAPGPARPWLARLGRGRLPGELVIERGHFRLYLPISTSILVSLIRTIVLQLLRK